MCLRVVLIYLIYSCLLFVFIQTEKRCESFEVRNIEDFKNFYNCNIIVGNVRIINIDFTEIDRSLIRTDVEEITDYLFIHRVHGLESIQLIFPRLVLIRGRRLLFKEYSLIIYENRQLLNLGLETLLRIEKGSVRIESNPELCYADTVNWILLFKNKSFQHFSIKHNRAPNQCATCATDVKKNCWSKLSIQKNALTFDDSNHCPTECNEVDCKKSHECCISSCLNQCSSQNCTLCSNLNQNGKCVENCSIPYFELNKRECVSAQDCRKIGMIPHAGVCIDKLTYKNDNWNGSTFFSNNTMICEGVYKVKTVEDLNNIQDCVTIRGSLILQLTEAKFNIISNLEKALKNLKEITGYLKIDHSPQIVSLSFLGNLDTISGNDLYANLYALYIVDNYHLEAIWRKNQKVAIIKGQVFFHLNPRLCYEKIIALQPSLKNGGNITILNASPNSNGERVICGSSVRKFDAIIEDINSTAVLITVENMPADDLDVLIGYQYFYKSSPTKNITMYDGRHGCGHDNWRLDISASKNRRHIITKLKPYTQYAYFVKTLTRVDYHKQVEAYSEINYFQTLPSKPGPVAKMYYHSISGSEIIVHWWPPRITNGFIDKYIINVEKYKYSGNIENEIHGNLNKIDNVQKSICQCENKIDNGISIVPNDENYYNKDEITYEDALPNLIYVPRQPEILKKQSNNSMVQYSRVQPLIKAQNKSNLNNDEFMKHMESHFQNFRKNFEKQAIAIQDTGKENFFIVKPMATCNQTNASIQYQLENGCKLLERFSGEKVSGQEHSYTLRNLEVEVTYRISVRACVRELINGCGIETSIFAETESKGLESFLKELRDYN